MHYHAGMIAYKFGDLTSAKKHLNQALQMNPHFSLTQVPVLRKTLDAIEQKVAVVE
jgi:Tfp pilus assembly protein PilF